MSLQAHRIEHTCIRFARVCTKVEDFNDRNSFISRTLFNQSFLFHEFEKHLPIFSTGILILKETTNIFSKTSLLCYVSIRTAIFFVIIVLILPVVPEGFSFPVELNG